MDALHYFKSTFKYVFCNAIFIYIKFSHWQKIKYLFSHSIQSLRPENVFCQKFLTLLPFSHYTIHTDSFSSFFFPTTVLCYQIILKVPQSTQWQSPLYGVHSIMMVNPSLSLYLPSRPKLWCTLQLRGQIHTLPLLLLFTPTVLYMYFVKSIIAARKFLVNKP